MGGIKGQRKKYRSPKRPWDPALLEYELRLVGEYGLRNKRELRRTEEMLRRIRSSARKLYILPDEERAFKAREIVSKLVRYGVIGENVTLDDVLKLTVKDLLERRFQTIVFKRGLAKSIYQARQLIVHGHVMVGNRVVRKPGKLLTVEEEASIRLNPKSSLANPEHPIWR